MGPAEGEVPEGYQSEVIWREDLGAAFREAKDNDLPIFVTFRCPPCDQCSVFDGLVMHGSELMTPLFEQFITVRITDASQIDQRLFRITEFQDMDLSWWGYFLSPDGKIYGVYGGKDHLGDHTRISETGLVNTMKRVLDHHYDPRLEKWDIDGDIPDLRGEPTLPSDLPGYKKLKRERPHLADQACLHCHQVNDILYMEAKDQPAFDKRTDVVPWPLPENIGLELDRDHGLLVVEVDPGGPADEAGIEVGDEIVVGDGRKLFSQADFRGVLHRAENGPTALTFYYNRGGQPAQAVVKTGEGWKAAKNFWRKSVYDGVLGAYPGFFPLRGPNTGKGKGLSVQPYITAKANHPAWNAGLRKNHEIIGVDGMSVDLTSREFLTWFRMNYEPGDTVHLTVLESGTVREIEYRLP
tara:strand:+ start:13385 stop:14614 length:1230 start_codon:yes stop_codon:yes gene_type:complete